MEYKSLCGVLKQLQEEGALRGVEAKGGAATMCNTTTATKTSIRQLWRTTTEKTGPLENRALLACDKCVMCLLHKHVAAYGRWDFHFCSLEVQPWGLSRHINVLCTLDVKFLFCASGFQEIAT